MNLTEAKKILEIDYRTSLPELKSIFRTKALILHPDTNKQPNASESFQQLKLAYEFLQVNLHLLPLKPPSCPQIYRILEGKKLVLSIQIPKDSLKEDDLCVNVIWGERETRVIIPKGTELPTVMRLFGKNVNLSYDRA